MTGLAPSVPQSRPADHSSSNAGASAARSDQSVGRAGGDTAGMQTDVLKAVTQLLQQSQTQVGSSTF